LVSKGDRCLQSFPHPFASAGRCKEALALAAVRELFLALCPCGRVVHCQRCFGSSPLVERLCGWWSGVHISSNHPREARQAEEGNGTASHLNRKPIHPKTALLFDLSRKSCRLCMDSPSHMANTNPMQLAVDFSGVYCHDCHNRTSFLNSTR